MDGLFVFEGATDFVNFCADRPMLSSWGIWPLGLEERAKKLTGNKYFKEFKEKFSGNDIFKYEVSDKEVVSWLDSIYLMYNVFYDSELNKYLDKDTKIIMEYPIPFSNNKRVDYIIQKGNKVLIIECGMIFSTKDLRKVYKKKINETIVYKELISNFTSLDMKLGVYSMIYLPEYQLEGGINSKHMDINMDNSIRFQMFIEEFFNLKEKNTNILPQFSIEDFE